MIIQKWLTIYWATLYIQAGSGTRRDITDFFSADTFPCQNRHFSAVYCLIIIIIIRIRRIIIKTTIYNEQ